MVFETISDYNLINIDFNVINRPICGLSFLPEQDGICC